MDELGALPPEDTVFLMVVSPLEAHGPHLPLGTDVLVSRELQRRYVAAIQREWSQMRVVLLPDLAIGADALPRAGSIGVSARTLEQVLFDHAQALATQGFRYLLVADNHGGPRHLLAMEAASRRAYQKYGFYLINPFVSTFRDMMQETPALLQATGLEADSAGGLSDLHAGTNESSLVLASQPSALRSHHARLSSELPPPAPTGFRWLAGLLRALGNRSLASDVAGAGAVSAWAGKGKSAYIGDPSRANLAAGEAMLAYRVARAMHWLARARVGETISMRPPLWPLRFLRFFR